MAPWRQPEGEESTTVRVGCLQKVVVLAEAMSVIPHRPLFAVQRCRMGNGDVVVVKCVVVGDLPIAGQAASALSQQGGCSVPGCSGFGMNQLQLLLER